MWFCFAWKMSFSVVYTLLSVHRLTRTHKHSLRVNNLWFYRNSAIFMGLLHRGNAHTHTSAQHNRCLDILSLNIQFYSIYMPEYPQKKLNLILIKSFSLLICIRIIDQIMLRNACSKTFYTLLKKILSLCKHTIPRSSERYNTIQNT